MTDTNTPEVEQGWVDLVVRNEDAQEAKRYLTEQWHREMCYCSAGPEHCVLIPMLWAPQAVLDALVAIDAKRRACYSALLGDGWSDYEAREQVWPADWTSESPDAAGMTFRDPPASDEKGTQHDDC